VCIISGYRCLHFNLQTTIITRAALYKIGTKGEGEGEGLEVLAFVNVINEVQNPLGFFTASIFHSQRELNRPRDGNIQIRWTEKAFEVPRKVLI
jgi:hypothetical protein